LIEEDDDKLVKLVQSSTRNLLRNFRERTELLSQSSNDLKLLVREGYDVKTSLEAARALFGDQKVSFIAIDGTESQDQELDMLLFYAGAVGYVGELEFTDKGCNYGSHMKTMGSTDISSAIPIHEEDASRVVGKVTEGGLEVDTERLPSSLMLFAEFYMAVKNLYENPKIKVVLLDRMPSINIPHLITNAIELLDSSTCILDGMDTPFGKVSSLDLELVRMFHPNDSLQIPVARSQLIKYAAINQLIKETDNISDDLNDNNNKNKTTKGIRYDDLLVKIGAKKDRLEKLTRDLKIFDEKFLLFDNDNGNNHNWKDKRQTRSVNSNVKLYWDRVFSASMKLAEHIFETPKGEHPLLYGKNGGPKSWITSGDLDYMTLVMIYALIRLAWEKKVLVIGLVKDIGAAEMIKTVIPILQNVGKVKFLRELPKFNSDKMLLQVGSVIGGNQSMKAPWRTFEFDSCFKTIVPLIEKTNDKSGNSDSLYNDNNKNDTDDNHEWKEKRATRVLGAFKNLISSERMFLKSYIQLWCSETDPAVRSHVFSYDRPCYPGFDEPGEILLQHEDGGVIEEISPIIHFDKDSKISHLVMDILCSMSLEVIPECLGHNYPLFLADKKAKSVLKGTRTSYISIVAFELASSKFDQQVLYKEKFRDFRAQMESSRKK
jgi:hypothetical protein